MKIFKENVLKSARDNNIQILHIKEDPRSPGLVPAV